ncbi:MAG TPA: hypothetical protein VHX17_08225 [Candidatus Cybelea sp.]|jgi:hypothetical protein|nr:hypothetical protein [Candidatus Cybelea sp.]
MKCWSIATIVFALSGCAGGGNNGFTAPASAARPAAGADGGSLGPILSTSDGGQIFGFDIDQNGDDGVLASWHTGSISVQTFNTATGKITRTFGRISGKRALRGDDYLVDGIFAGDVGLVDHQKAGIPGQTPAKDRYESLDPVTKQRLGARWKLPAKLFNVLQWAPNQSTSTSVFFGYQRSGSDPPGLLVANVAKGAFERMIPLNPNQFFLSTQPQLAEDTVHNRAVMASSPSFGGAGGPPPVISAVDLKSGKVESQFSGATCPGLAGCGYANGIAYDSATGVACTTTELDGGIEFYNVAKQTGFREGLGSGGSQLNAGAYVANDPVHQLFLIAQPFSSTSSGSSIQVYAENGDFVESIDGFDFTDAGFLVVPIRISINPHARTGWVNGPGSNQLQEFSY